MTLSIACWNSTAQCGIPEPGLQLPKKMKRRRSILGICGFQKREGQSLAEECRPSPTPRGADAAPRGDPGAGTLDFYNQPTQHSAAGSGQALGNPAHATD